MKLPLSDIKAYLSDHEKAKDEILNLIKFEKDAFLTRTQFEEKVPQQLLKIQKSITSIFKKNNINLSSQADHDKKLLDLFSE
jgi:hypothetical protein